VRVGGFPGHWAGGSSLPLSAHPRHVRRGLGGDPGAAWPGGSPVTHLPDDLHLLAQEVALQKVTEVASARAEARA
jgi:hypothetical protein